MSFGTRFKQAIAVMKENSPVLLTIANGIGTVGAVILSARAGWKANNLIREAESREGRKLTPKERVKECWKIFVPTAAATTASLASGIGATVAGAKQTAAIGAVASASELALDELKAKVREKVGEKKADQIQEELDIQKAQRAVDEGGAITITDGGNSLFVESFCGTIFRSSSAAIERGVNDIDHRLASGEMYVSYNELREAWGLESVDSGRHFYFTPENRPVVVFRTPECAPTLKNGEPYAVVSFAYGGEPVFETQKFG
jgi:hypothetical protein